MQQTNSDPKQGGLAGAMSWTTRGSQQQKPSNITCRGTTRRRTLTFTISAGYYIRIGEPIGHRNLVDHELCAQWRCSLRIRRIHHAGCGIRVAYSVSPFHRCFGILYRGFFAHVIVRCDTDRIEGRENCCGLLVWPFSSHSWQKGLAICCLGATCLTGARKDRLTGRCDSLRWPRPYGMGSW